MKTALGSCYPSKFLFFGVTNVGNTGKSIATAATMGLNYAERLLQGIPEDRFARLAAPGGTIVDANHPAFIIGHLGLYPDKVVEHLGASRELTKPSEAFETAFSKTAKCTDDPNGDIYPSMEEICGFFRTAYPAAIEALHAASDETLAAANPVDSPMAKVLDTLGGMLNFYMTGHVMVHLGQLSTWRRMEGLPPA